MAEIQALSQTQQWANYLLDSSRNVDQTKLVATIGVTIVTMVVISKLFVNIQGKLAKPMLERILDLKPSKEMGKTPVSMRPASFSNLKGWTLVDNQKRIEKTFLFDNYNEGLCFLVLTQPYVQKAWHHPEITFTYPHVKVSLTTRDIDGLSKNDYQVALMLDIAYNKITQAIMN